MKKGIVLLLAASFMLMSMFTGDVKAANGSITCSHGNRDGKYTGGEMWSTAYETTLEVKTKVYEDTFGTETLFTSGTIAITKSAGCWVNVLGLTGKSYCYYFVNDLPIHESTAWFSFDFKQYI